MTYESRIPARCAPRAYLCIAIALCLLLPTVKTIAAEQTTASQWGIFEVEFKGTSDGNPYLDVTLSADFTQADRTVHATGFYDDAGTYRIRFMPESQGKWSYKTQSNRPELTAKTGEFTCTPPAPGVHGPVRVQGQWHFAYADGTPFRPLGTTAYNWINQGPLRKAQTLESLGKSPFNKVRMAILPMQYDLASDPTDAERMRGPGGERLNLPELFAFKGEPLDKWDYTRFSPEFFREFEKCLVGLGERGIEADVILLFSNNKKMNFWDMGAEVDDRYIRYVLARISAYHNVWWSLANEWDLLRNKSVADWDRMGDILLKQDPYNHLRGLHQTRIVYNKPWMTHASLQAGEVVQQIGGPLKRRATYGKPIMFDEIQYEGDIDRRWGQLSAENMTHRFWVGTVCGTYVGHGETYKKGPWSSSGGELIGQSPPRLAFLRDILATFPPEGIDPIANSKDDRVGGKPGEFYLLYFGKDKPTQWQFELPAHGLKPGTKMRVEVIDCWNMTITPVEQVFTVAAHDDATVRAEGDASVKLPGNALMALRIKTVR